MTIGTKSVLYGAHCFFLHPWFVALAWWRLYGFPWDPRLWVAFFVHDLGYIGKPNMDGEEGERHPEWGARLAARLFDRYPYPEPIMLWCASCSRSGSSACLHRNPLGPWGKLILLHSRYYAKAHHLQPSRLCVADKLAISLTPAWLYLPMVRLTGEIHEYMAHAHHRVKGNEALSAEERRLVTSASERDWYRGVQEYCKRWALEHADGKRDTWTSSSHQRATVDANGVWK